MRTVKPTSAAAIARRAVPAAVVPHVRQGDQMTGDLTPADVTCLRAALDLARRSRHRGNHPFGALLADAASLVAAEAENTVVSEHDVTGHAETNLVRIASRRFGRAYLRSCTIYASTEPCAMCSGAIYWSGISRVVYGLSEAGLRTLTGRHQDNPTMSLPCRDVFAHGQGCITVIGPALEDEARSVHHGFWT
jgi:tRNA(Arg) A34 adenosine deaminase TadA